MPHHSARPAIRWAALLTAPMLVLAPLAAPAQAAPVTPPPGADARPAAAGASWLSGQLTDGLMFNPNFGGFDDIGLSIDTAYALDAVGGHDTTIATITDAVAANAAAYITNGDSGPDDRYAGSLAKALVLAQLTDRDPADFGGFDLVGDLEQRVTVGGPTNGRIADDTEFGDFANTIGQAFTVGGLTEAGSPLADEATDFLLAQQCAAGFFRLSFAAPDAADQSCDGATPAEAVPGPDTTALVVTQLASLAGTDTDIATALEDAQDWLLSQQAADGSFTAGTATEGKNTNSTGLAAWALGLLGEESQAADAAAWVTGRQAVALPGCASDLDVETGAVAFDDAALATGRTEGITDGTSDQWRRATAQALPGLIWRQAGETGDVAVAAPTSFRRAGSKVVIRVRGLAAGEQVCVSGRGVSTVVTGPGVARVPAELPARGGNRRFVARGLDGQDSATVRTLGRKTIPFTLAKRRVGQSRTQTVRVRGLAGGEPVKVSFRGRRVATGEAGPQGRFKATFKVGRKLGTPQVKVVGAFANLRNNSRTFRVVRAR